MLAKGRITNVGVILVSTEQFQVAARPNSCLYKQGQSLTGRQQRRQAAAIPCQAYRPSQEAKSFATHPFASESNIEENVCRTRRRIPSLEHPSSFMVSQPFWRDQPYTSVRFH
jgi:hypothetical protein